MSWTLNKNTRIRDGRYKVAFDGLRQAVVTITNGEWWYEGEKIDPHTVLLINNPRTIKYEIDGQEVFVQT